MDMSLVKQLREQSGAPITDCRDAVTQALTQASPSALTDSAILSSATDILRKKGISTASKKSGRVAAEGLVAVCIDSGRQRAALVEVNSETDFAARNERFQQTLQRVAAIALQAARSEQTAGGAAVQHDALTLLSAGSAAHQQVQAIMTEAVSALRENIQLRRAAALSVEGDGGQGVIGVYVHNAVAPAQQPQLGEAHTRLGRTAALVALSFTPSSASSSGSPSSSIAASLSSLANKLAMQVTAASPLYLSRSDIPAAVLQHEREILSQQASTGDKAAKDSKHLSRIIDGRLNKFYEESTLMEQKLVVVTAEQQEGEEGEAAAGSGKLKVRQWIESEGKRLGGVIAVKGFLKYTVGEGVKRDEKKLSFAEEVATKLSK